MQRKYIDVNAGLDRTNHKDVEISYTPADLACEMKYYRIHASLVYSHISRDYSYVKGNRKLIGDISANQRLFGAAIVVPEARFEFEEGGTYYKMLVNSGIRAFKMFPALHEFKFDPFFIENIAGFMSENNIPLILDITEVDFLSVSEVLQAFSNLKILLCKTYWNQNRDLFKLMEKFGNLYFEISSNQSNDILAVSKKFFGIDRVLFGSDYPYKVIGGLKALVEYSGLSEADKDRVAGGSAARLFGIDTESLSCYDENECRLDPIAARVDRGLPLDNILVIDAHTHVVEKEDRTVSSPAIFNGDDDMMVGKMDALGVDKMFTSPWEGLMTGGDDANDTVLRAHGRHPGRIEAYATYNPNYKEDLWRVLDYYHGKCRFMGLKPYHAKHETDLLGDEYREWFQYGDENRLFTLVHTEGKATADKVEVLCRRYQNMAFIMAHSGQSFEMTRYNSAIAKKYDNVYLEITFTSLTNGAIEYMVKEAGADKVLYGSDAPMRDPAPQLAWVCYARISEEDKKKILGLNMQKLIDRCFTYESDKRM